MGRSTTIKKDKELEICDRHCFGFTYTTGTKMWITNKPVAEVLVVYAKTDPNNPKPQHGITCFLIEKVRIL